MDEPKVVRKDSVAQLPEERIDWFVEPIARFVQVETAAGVVLLLFTVIALILANSPLSDVFRNLWHLSVGINIGTIVFERSLHSWINDAVMTLFFFLIALELKRELVLGELREPRLAMLSVSAAVGGMLVPALIYLAFQYQEPGQNGWGTVMATDTAFVIGCLALLGKRIPKSLRVFMLSLAVVDDIGAIIVVAIGYGSDLNWLFIGLALLGFLSVKTMAFLGVRNISLFFIAGGLIWLAVDASGIHPTITGVILGLMTPTKQWVSDDRFHTIIDSVVDNTSFDPSGDQALDPEVLKTTEAAAREVLSPVERLEIALHPWVGFVVMPLFAFANAGISFAGADFESSLTLAVVISFVMGKPVGVFLFSWLAVKLHLAVTPVDLSWRMILGGGMLAGIGFTMALFIANLAYSPDQINAVKLGILSATMLSALSGLLLLRFWVVDSTAASQY
ncbi:Na+/H+ antiporter NhaA [Simiduia litorea]|uniref:Na+/H+ antiporter NhaA n=1 Tax=Simiduia litorea TaxID=1435348 RepID=UPI0036F43928